MGKYESNAEKVKNFIEIRILPVLKKRNDLDYYETINAIASHLSVSKKVVEKEIDSLIELKKVQEIRQLTILEEEIPEWLKETIEREKETNQILKENMEMGVKKK